MSDTEVATFIALLVCIFAVIAVVVSIGIHITNKAKRNDKVSIFDTAYLGLLYNSCIEEVECIQSVFNVDRDHKLYSANKVYIDAIVTNTKIIKAHLKNIHHYIDVKCEELDKDSYELAKETYVHIESELKNLVYIDRKILSTDKSLFELSSSLISVLARFTINNYKELLSGDKEHIKLTIDKFKEINAYYQLKEETLQELTTGKNLKDLENKYMDNKDEQEK